MKIAQFSGEKIWGGIEKAPFALLLVTDSVEFLINHPAPSSDFSFLGNDSILASKVYYRKTVFNKHFLATFPAVGELNTIVVGTPENTGKHSTDWIITLLHEHFHQYTYSSPNYYADVAKLELSGGDQSGMWMLNYPFPYKDSIVNAQYSRYTGALADALSAIGTDSFASSVQTYAAERNRFREILKPPDYRYFSFQIWQEGIARYTEFKVLEALETYTPSPEVSLLPDFIPFRNYREQFLRKQKDRTAGWSLRNHQRECFYALGLGEGLILDKLNPAWREKYQTERFYIERYADELNPSRMSPWR